MQNYQSITQAIESQKKPLIVFSIAVLVLNTIICGYIASIALDRNIKQYTSLETCLYGMRSIFENDANKDLVNSTIIKDLSKRIDSFKVDRIHLIKVINKYECDVFSSDSKGARRFLVKLEKNPKLLHGMRIFDISERKINSRYQI